MNSQRFYQRKYIAMTVKDKHERQAEETEIQQDHLDLDTDEGGYTDIEDQDEAGESVDQLAILQEKLETQTKKAQDNMELAQRTQAEMENLRKRTIRDIENAHKYALERFLNELLPVLDSLELGIQASETTTDITGLREGMHLTLKKFSDSIEKAGVVLLNPVDEKFNPDKHSAVSMIEAEDTEAGMVIKVLQKGYELNGRLVRPAMVVVSR